MIRDGHPAKADAMILGAGAAGLAAALDLSRAGLRTTVLEARDRIGGRILTLHDPQWPAPVELGAEFIHGEAEETFEITRAARLAVTELSEDHLLARDGALRPIPDFWGKVDETLRDISRRMARKRGDISFTEYLGSTKVPSDLREMLTLFVEGYHASHADKISARWLGASAGDDGSAEKQFRIPAGTDGVVQWLRGGLDPERVEVRLNTVATELHWRRGEVVLHAATGAGRALAPFRARTAIVTLPLAVLKTKALRFVPALADKARALNRLEVGHVFKIVLRFRHAFWEEDDFVRRRLGKGRAEPGALNFVHSPEADVPTWWTALPAHVPLLTGWAGGPRGEAMLDESQANRLDRALSSLAKVLAVPRRTLDELLESSSHHDWRADPFSRGAYAYVAVGGVAAQKALARPEAGTLFFAGEAIDPRQTGTVAGAIASGRRAVRELLGAVRAR